MLDAKRYHAKERQGYPHTEKGKREMLIHALATSQKVP